MKRAVLAAVLLSTGAAQAQTIPPPAAAPATAAPAAADWRPLDPDNTLVIDSTKGRIVVEMRPDVAPLAVARVKTLTRKGYYDAALFYRVLPFMAQGGDKGTKQYKSDLPNIKAVFTFTKTPAMPYTVVGDVPGAEVGFIGSLPVQVQTADQKAWAFFCPGIASMPHYDDPNTANSQLFFMRTHGASLEKTFTAFGRVIDGQDVVAKLNNGEPPPNPDKMTRVRVMADIPAAERPKLEVMDNRSPAFAAEVAKAIAAKGGGFTLCDVPIPTRTPPA
ncbi:MAG: peptidylprolyl isomerase [Caulobacteraceae bacterium]